MQTKNIPLFKVFMADEASGIVSDVLKSGYIGQGPKVDEFEGLLKKSFANDFLLTTNSCTSALQLAVHMLKPGDRFSEDDEIIVTPMTCFASIAAIMANDCKVRWADVDPNTCNIDLDDVERKMGPNTRGVMVVHWGGYPVNLDRLKSIQARFKELYGRPLPIIEDCAHCWDSEYKGTRIGNSGNYCAFSFQAIKFLTTGDGGMLITPDDQTYRKAKLMRWFGLDREKGQSFRCAQDIALAGFKYHLTDIAAGIGIANFPHMHDLLVAHYANAAHYHYHLHGVDGVQLLERHPDYKSSSWLFTMRVKDRLNFVKKLESKGIAANPVHARCDKHSCVYKYRSSLPNMDVLGEEMICIPVGWWVDSEDLNYIVESIKEGW